METGVSKLCFLFLLLFYPCGILAKDEDHVITLLLPIFGISGADKTRCSPEFNYEGLIMVEAVVYALRLIKNDSDFLPNITLQHKFINHCGSDDRALKSLSDEFSKLGETPKVSAVVTSGLHPRFADATANLISMKKTNIPVITFDSESFVDDSDVFRMVPNRNVKDVAFVDIMEEFEWNYVIVMANDDANGYKLADHFKKQVEKKGFCVFKEYYVDDQDSVQKSLTNIIGDTSDGNVHVVILLTSPELSTKITQEAVRQSVEDITWFGDEDSWKRNISIPVHQYPYIGGMLYMEHYRGPNTKDFKAYILGLDEGNHTENPWFKNDQKTELIKIADKAAPIIDAVFAIAHMLNQQQTCQGDECKKSMSDHMEDLDFDSPTGNRVAFDDNKMISSFSFSLKILQKNTGAVGTQDVGMLKLVEAGKWNKNSTGKWININKNSLWKEVPKSQCNDPCKPGWFVQSKIEIDASPCCFDCIPCKPGTVSYTENEEFCQECPEGLYTINGYECIPQKLLHIQVEDAEALVLIFLVTILACLLLCTMFIIDKNTKTPVVRNSTNATMGLLFTIFANTFLPLVVIVKPTENACAAYTVYYVIGIGLPIALLLAKCKVIRDTFYDEEGNRKASFGPCNPTLAVFMFFVVLHIIIVVIYIEFYPGKVLMFDTDMPDTKYIECSAYTTASFLILFFYVGFLSLLLTIFSASSLDVEDNLRESKWVCYCIFNFYVLIFFYIVASFSLDTGKGKVTAIAYIMFLHPVNFFLCIFGPKLYVIILHPEDNRPEASPLLLHEQTQAKISERLSYQKPSVNESPLLSRVSASDRNGEKSSATPV